MPVAALITSAAALLASPASQAQAQDPVEALLRRMTLDEKLGQLSLVLSPVAPEAIATGAVGAAMNVPTREEARALRDMTETSRLRIPPLIALDVVHGYRTLFPVPLAEAATFDPALAEKASYWAAREASAAGVHITFGPMADVSRDVRWGRLVEGAGEDVFLASLITGARVRGFRAGGLATVVKHFAGYGAAIGGRDYEAADIPDTLLRDVYLPPFRAAIDAGAEAVMTAFTAVNGLPIAANRPLLEGVLRGELGFRGLVMSDYAAADELVTHGVADGRADAARQSLLAGVDMEMAGDAYRATLPQQIRDGRLPVAAVDAAVRRVLQLKHRLGLLEPEAGQNAAPDTSEDISRAAREIAAESMVLLKNDAQVLPLTERSRKIAVVGSLATSARDQNGPHEARAREEETVTLLEGLKQRAATAGVELIHAAGCDLACTDQRDIDQAVQQTRDADLVIAVLGEPRDLTGEGATRAHLDLPGHQEELLRNLAATGKPVVLVLMAGRPLAMGPLLDSVSAALMIWYPGTQGGPALADVLFGDVNPSGKLPHTWPRALGQVPLYYDHLPSGRPHKPGSRFTLGYIDEAPTPQFPFGFGLSYTSFAYSDMTVASRRLGTTDTLEVRVRLTNTGARAGKEAAQLYVRDPVASRSRPVRQLKAIQKVELAPGESRQVTFRLPVRDLGFHLPDGSYTVEAGAFDLWVGGDSTATLAARFEVTDTMVTPAPSAAAPIR